MSDSPDVALVRASASALASSSVSPEAPNTASVCPTAAPADTPSARPTTKAARVPAREPWTRMEVTLMVGAVALIVMNAFEGLATTAIMPNIVADLGAESWFSVASGSAMAASLFAVVIAGALADWRGIRSTLLAGVAAFALGLGLCALAPHVSLFVVGRLIQGLGGGLVIVPLYMLIGSVASEKHRPAYFAAFSLAWTLPAIIGPAIAGWVAQTLGWRWVFGAVPLMSVVALTLFVPLLRVLPTEKRPFPRKLKALVGMALTASGGILILQLGGAFDDWRLFAMSTVGLVLTVVYLPKLLPPGFFAFKAGLPSLLGSRMCAMASMSGVHAFIPLLLQRVHGWDATYAAMAVTIGSLSWSVGAVFQARVADPVLRRRFPLIGASLLFAGAVGTASLVFPHVAPWVGLVMSFLVSAGVGLLHSTISGLSLSVTPTKDHGKVSSWLQVADSAGTAVQLAIISVVLAAWAHMPFVGGTFWLYLPAMLMGIAAGGVSLVYARAARLM